LALQSINCGLLFNKAPVAQLDRVSASEGSTH
ncbi:MAG: hypothetical protein ACJAS1_001913, partial [Oleiphilaceae bacterium]